MSELTAVEVYAIMNARYESVGQVEDAMTKLRAVNAKKRPEVSDALETLHRVRSALKFLDEHRKHGGRVVHRAVYETPEAKQVRIGALGDVHKRMERNFLRRLVRAFQEQENAVLRTIRKIGGEAP